MGGSGLLRGAADRDHAGIDDKVAGQLRIDPVALDRDGAARIAVEIETSNRCLDMDSLLGLVVNLRTKADGAQ